MAAAGTPGVCNGSARHQRPQNTHGQGEQPENCVLPQRWSQADPDAAAHTVAYRQQALACTTVLREGSRRLCELKTIAPDTGRILLRNVYAGTSTGMPLVKGDDVIAHPAGLDWGSDPG